MNEYLMLGLVGVIALAAGFGGSWLGKVIRGDKKDKV